MIYRYDSYCGLYCGACDTLQANREGRINELAKTWNRKPDELSCHGCKTTVNAVFCGNCAIRSCAINKKVEYCFQCHDYPCQRLVDFRQDRHPHHSIILHNLEMIQKSGVENWLIEQEKRWRCPECKTVFAWYEQECDHCGAKLYDCRAEEKDLR